MDVLTPTRYKTSKIRTVEHTTGIGIVFSHTLTSTYSGFAYIHFDNVNRFDFAFIPRGRKDVCYHDNGRNGETAKLQSFSKPRLKLSSPWR